MCLERLPTWKCFSVSYSSILDSLFASFRGWRRLAFLDYGGYANTNMHCCPQEDRKEAMDGRLHCIFKMKNFMFLIEDVIGPFNNSMSCQGSKV